MTEVNAMRILAIVSGEYGQRHVANVQAHAPAGWTLETWQTPAVLPPVIDYPEDYVPQALPPADLILSFAELPGVAELLPDIARKTGARAVIAPVDNEAWLPRGLARQLRGWLQEIGVTCVTPKPLCSLTESDYLTARRKRLPYEDPWIAAFARHFGQPELRLVLDPEARTITGAEVVRDAVCGCARHVAQGLAGLSADDAEQQAGLLHHHYPCLASMGIDTDFDDTLMHISGNLLKDNVGRQVKPFRRVQTFIPGTKAD
jgi:thymidylate synthase